VQAAMFQAGNAPLLAEVEKVCRSMQKLLAPAA
jgi:hypothetical protein